MKLSRGILTEWDKFRNKTVAWLKAIRLQFYLMTWVAYAAGAYGAASLGYNFDTTTFWIGYLWLFLVEVATVLANDYYDFNTDQQNKSFGPFTGGSRVIVEKLLSFKEIRRGMFIAMALSFVAAGLLILNTSGTVISIVLLLVFLFVLALGYTVPPLKLSYRGMGEVDVGITHSLGVILCGYVFQGGNLHDPFPWLLSVPLFLGILPSIILAGIPDYEADKAVSKITIAVKLGKKWAAMLAIFFTILSAVAGIAWQQWNIAQGAFGNIIYGVIPHAALLIVLLYRYIKHPSPHPRIDLLMVASLTYVLWFGIIPLLRLA
jgi:1,4-dihydroxy-2-naphthoate octaprenyltransferase